MLKHLLILPAAVLCLAACSYGLDFPRMSFDNSRICNSQELSFRALSFRTATKDLKDSLDFYEDVYQRYWVNGSVDPEKYERWLEASSTAYKKAYTRWVEAHNELENCRTGPVKVDTPEVEEPGHFPRIDVPGP